jgi:RNA polymerase sigma-70 factor (ECF subfamily)
MTTVGERTLELRDEDAEIGRVGARVHLRDEQDPHGARNSDGSGAIKKRVSRRIVFAVRDADGVPLAEIEALYRARLGAFRRVARGILRDDDAACDAVQEAFASAVRNRRSFRGDGPIEGWVWRIVVNAARMHRRVGAERLPASSSVEQFVANGQPEIDQRVRAAIATLPERQRLVLFLRYFADLDYATIAEALEIAPGTVGATLNSARSSLLRVLEEVPR